MLLERHNGDGYLARRIVSRGQTDRLQRAFRTSMMQTEVLFLCCSMHSGDDINFKHGLVAYATEQIFAGSLQGSFGDRVTQLFREVSGCMANRAAVWIPSPLCSLEG